MEDELEDKLIYKSIVSHARIISKFAMSVPINLSYFGYCWRMLKIHIFKPEIILFSVVIFILFAYIQNLNFRSQSFLKNFRFPVVNNNSSLKKFQLRGIKDNTHWAYSTGNVAVFAIQGRRSHMEDRFVINENIKDTGVSLFAIFDGHGGEFAAEYAAENLINALKLRVVEIKNLAGKQQTLDGSDNVVPIKSKSLKEERYQKAEKPATVKKTVTDDNLDSSNLNLYSIDTDLLDRIRKKLPITKDVRNFESSNSAIPVFDPTNYLEINGTVNYNKLLTDQVLATDKVLVEAAKKNSNIAGTTAIIALIENKQLIVANVGDSRGVMYDSKGNAIPLSFDHKPQQMRERKRIKEAGGFISFNGVWRVAGILATSRALGDYPLKDWNLVIADPDILTFDLSNHKPQFLIFASDGLWDMFTNEEAVAFVKEHIHEPFCGAKSLALQAYYKGSLDNITVMIINLSEHNWSDDSLSVITKTS